MSTLAAARADNFYFPPNFDPKKGGLNKQQGQHPLRERAKKLDQGILVIRFEMPFNVWCIGCNHLIGKGVRFNAEKQQIGNYHSTKIWSFSMTAPCCQQRIEVQTDPKHAQYKVVSGGRQKVESYSAADAGVIELMDEHDKAQAGDPLVALERGESHRARRQEYNERLIVLKDDSQARYRDDYAANKLLRRQMRSKRDEEKNLEARRKALGLGEQVQLLPAAAADARAAAQVRFGQPDGHAKNWQRKRKAIAEASIFAGPAVAAPRIKRMEQRPLHL